MAINTVTLNGLQQELISLILQTPTFSGRVFSVFDANDLVDLGDAQIPPLAAVMYNGGGLREGVKNAAVSADMRSSSSVLVTFQFTVLLLLRYRDVGQSDSKPQALTILEELRRRILGYMGVNTRPWRFVVEKPELEASGDGLVCYSQVWQTDAPIVGTWTNQS